MADKISGEEMSAEATARLLLDELMPGSAPLQVLLELAYLGEACVSSDVSSRPLMGCQVADRESVMGRLAEIKQSLGGTA